MGIKHFFLKQVVKHKMKGAPEAEQERMLALMERNPDFFKKINDEVKRKVKSGKDETVATMEVMRSHQAEFQRIMMDQR